MLAALAAVLLGTPAAAAATTAAPAAAPEGLQLTVLFSNDLYGRFRRITCDDPGAAVVDFANLVGATDAARRTLEDLSRPAPIVVHSGDIIGPKAMARFLLSKGEPGAKEITGWLARAGYDVIALGNNDFASVPRRLRDYLEAGHSRGIRFTAANLECDEPDADICDHLRPGGKRYLMLERGGVRIAVFGVLHGDLREDLPSSHLAGVRVVDPIERAQEVVAQARQDGADLVFVVAHTDHPSTAPRHAIRMARLLPGIDLIVGSALHAYDERGLALLQFADGNTPIVGGDAYAGGLGVASLRVRRVEGRWRVGSMETRVIPTGQVWPDAEVRRELDAVHTAYCNEWYEPVGDGRLSQPMTADDFSEYLMAVMRQETGCEVAFVHRGMIEPHGLFPIVGHVARHHFFAGIPWRNRLYTFRLEGSALKTLCKKMPAPDASPDDSDLLALGLTCSGSGEVNGRPIDADSRYDVVTIEYLAKGAHGYFSIPGDAMRLHNPGGVEEPPILGELTRAFLSGPQFAGAHAAPIDAALNFPNLRNELRWTFRGDVDLNVADTTLRPKGYAEEESQLARDEVFSLRGEARGHVGADSEQHGLSADARIKYAQSTTRVTQEDGTKKRELVESDDLDTLEVLYRLNALRTQHARWWSPIPYTGGNLETEITPPEVSGGGEEIPRKIQLTGTAGARFKLLPELEAKVGGGVRDNLSDDEKAVLGAELGYKLNRMDLARVLESSVQLESELSAFWSFTSDDRTLKGTWINRIYFGLGAGIQLNVTHDLFFFQKVGTGAGSELDRIGLASQLTVGLGYHAVTAVQTF